MTVAQTVCEFEKGTTDDTFGWKSGASLDFNLEFMPELLFPVAM